MKNLVAFFGVLFLFVFFYFIYYVSHLFFPIRTVEPVEYGVFIAEIQNQSDKDVIFVNLFESKNWVIKPMTTVVVDSWLAASDYKKLKMFTVYCRGSVMEKNARSMVIITKKGLFYLNVGRYHNWETGDDPDAQIWVLSEKNNNKKIEPIKGWAIVQEIGSIDSGKRNLIITNDGDLVVKVPQKPEEEKRIAYEISSASDFWHYMYELKFSKIYKSGFPLVRKVAQQYSPTLNF